MRAPSEVALTADETTNLPQGKLRHLIDHQILISARGDYQSPNLDMAAPPA